MKTTEQLQEELISLQLEKNDCEYILSQVKKAEERLRELNPSWHDKGLIEDKKQEIKDSRFPIFETYDFIIKRIIAVDNKWISIKCDGINQEIIRYNRDNGWRERSRCDFFSIDVEKAIEIWEKHIQESK